MSTDIPADEDDDFGNFEESAALQFETQTQQPEQIEDLDILFDCIGTVLDESLESCVLEAGDVDPLSLTCLLDKRADVLESSTCALWTSLKIVEESLALKFTYPESMAFKLYAKSLNLDINLAKLGRRNLPKFASHFNPLETLTPEKLSIQLNNNELDYLESASTATKNVKNDANSVVNLDLNYFVSNDHPISKDGRTKQQNFRQPVNGERVENLSNKAAVLPKFDVATVQTEALKIAGKLPDLNFMLSSVLMFPIKETYNNNNNNNNVTNNDNNQPQMQDLKDCDKF